MALIAWGLPKERFACLARIRHEPKPWTAKNFGNVEWLPEISTDPMLLGLLPRGTREIAARDLATWPYASACLPSSSISSSRSFSTKSAIWSSLAKA